MFGPFSLVVWQSDQEDALTACQFHLHTFCFQQRFQQVAFVALNFNHAIFQRAAAAAFFLQLSRQFRQRVVIQVNPGNQAYTLSFTPAGLTLNAYDAIPLGRSVTALGSSIRPVSVE